MSQDGISFDDVKYREPERRRRLDRDRRWACLAYEIPGPDDLPIYLDRQTADAIERHALRDTSVELGGILLGKECVDDQTGLPFVWVTKALEAKHYENTQASFTYTHESWEEITRDRDRLHPDLDIVGWYHTHPDFGIFLSGHDLFIHQHFFAQALQVAYVVDPVRQTRGFFQWRDGGLAQVGGYYLYADRGDRVALSRLVNDLENLPNTEGGGGLSPRLEAELIAMLTRPAHYTSSGVDRTQSAALFSLAGGIAGMIALAAVLWLNTLSNRIQDQSLVLKDLERTAEDSAARQSLALDALLEQASGIKAEKFLAQYEKANREREELRQELERSRTTTAALNDRARALFSKNDKLERDLTLANKDLEAYRQLRKEHPDIHARVNGLVAESEEKAQEIKELKDLLDNAEGRKAAELTTNYNRAWYAAVVGWGASLLLALGLLTVMTQPTATVEEAADPAPGPQPPPTHRIT